MPENTPRLIPAYFRCRAQDRRTSFPVLQRALPKIAVAACVLLALACPCLADPSKLGFSIDVKGDGILNPVVTKILVTSVEKDSRAESVGMISGDEIIQIDGRAVAGRFCGELQSFLKFDAGETRVLRLEHVDGSQFDAKLTKPKE